MFKELASLSKKAERNKRGEQGPCEGCPLAREYDGPVFIKHQSRERPRVVLISESPAAYEEIGFRFSELNHWISERLKDIHNLEWGGREIGQLNNLTRFLAGLTDSKLVSDPKSLSTVGDVYWTHAMKCFIQRTEPSVIKAKERRQKAFENACLSCAPYLRKEIKTIQPRLVVAIGEKALHALIPKPKHFAGKSVILPQSELVFTYHPGYRNISMKEKGFTWAKERIAHYRRLAKSE